MNDVSLDTITVGPYDVGTSGWTSSSSTTCTIKGGETSCDVWDAGKERTTNMRKLVKVYVVDVDAGIVYAELGPYVVEDLESARLRAAVESGLGAEVLDDYDFVVHVIGDVRDGPEDD